MNSIYFASLGCSKNLVDSQVMLGILDKNNFSITNMPNQADVIIINTCSFIEASKVESIDTILELSSYKVKGKCKALVVSGCLAQRYPNELEDQLPEVDLFIGTGEYHRIAYLLKAFEEGKLKAKSFVEIPKYIHTEYDTRINTSPKYTAWLKISEGCNRNCTFCIIPSIRGALRSRSVESLIMEANSLSKNGVRELNLVSQDLSDYGVDLSDNNNLLNLLKGLDSVPGIDWIRLFYLYPDELSDDVIEYIASSDKICPYLDMPIQHFSDRILKLMNRKITGNQIIERINKLRVFNPNIMLRTSVIVGFPGETKEDFKVLVENISKIKFQHLGIFRYSDEDGTPAKRLKNKVEQDVIDSRFDRLHNMQKKIVSELNKSSIGKVFDVLVEGFHDETDFLIKGRHSAQAPDIDGNVIINDTYGSNLKIGDIVKVKITNILDYDLLGCIVNE